MTDKQEETLVKVSKHLDSYNDKQVSVAISLFVVILCVLLIASAIRNFILPSPAFLVIDNDSWPREVCSGRTYKGDIRIVSNRPSIMEMNAMVVDAEGGNFAVPADVMPSIIPDRSGGTYSVSVIFSMPYEIEAGDYQVVISVAARNQSNFPQFASVDIRLLNPCP